MKRTYRPILRIAVTISTFLMSCSLFTPASHPPTALPTEEPFIGPVAGPLEYAPDELPDAQRGTPYQAQVSITGNVTPVGDIYISEGTLPAGLELILLEGQDAAIISGTPEEAGTFPFIVSAWCFGTQVSGQTGEKEYSLIVN